MVFTMVVLTLWRYDVGDIFSGGRGAALAIGDVRLLSPSPSDARREVLEREAAVVQEVKPHGMLVIRTNDQEAVRRGIEIVLGRMAAQWRITDVNTPPGELCRFEIAVQLKPKVDPSELIAEIEARLSEEIAAAEYIPFGGSAKVD
jgi:hypothetical protein